MGFYLSLLHPWLFFIVTRILMGYEAVMSRMVIVVMVVLMLVLMLVVTVVMRVVWISFQQRRKLFFGFLVRNSHGRP